MENVNIKKKFIGVWELIHLDSQTLDGKDLTRWKWKGRLVYTEDGYISAQLGGSNIAKFKSENRNKATDKEVRNLFNEFESYSFISFKLASR